MRGCLDLVTAGSGWFLKGPTAATAEPVSHAGGIPVKTGARKSKILPGSEGGKSVRTSPAIPEEVLKVLEQRFPNGPWRTGAGAGEKREGERGAGRTPVPHAHDAARGRGWEAAELGMKK